MFLYMLQRVNFISEFCEFLPVISISGHYDTEHRKTSEELFRVYSETSSKKDWTLADIQ